MEKRELHAKIEEVQRELEEEQKATMELTRDMTRQYKGMQEELLNRVGHHHYVHGICTLLIRACDSATTSWAIRAPSVQHVIRGCMLIWFVCGVASSGGGPGEDGTGAKGPARYVYTLKPL
jgi:hypothetical protein